ncbi:hypothetical protein Y1Q_0016994 [Alligator mississippiensis]|uniref:Uncharacterized protein n=1 Tax=Alligator mississippiensis TaxID=8496 RepID=A0A151N3C8_ALLMI|nr:hypothetical protein Y1Q_0016994 [Alligator mississippiensis]
MVVLHFISQVLGINMVNKDLHLKLTLIWSVSEISHAIQDTDDSQSFQFTYKEELLGHMLVSGEEPWGPNCKGPDQSKAIDAAEEELRGLHEELKDSSPEAVLIASSHMAKVIGKSFPSNQAFDFVGSIMDGMLSASPMCATAAGHWFNTILREHGDALLDEATCASLEKLTTIHSSPVLRELLPEILCAFLEQFGRTVGQNMPMPTGSIWRRQLRTGQLQAVGNPCRLSMETLDCAFYGDPGLCTLRVLGREWLQPSVKRELGHFVRAPKCTMRGCASWPGQVLQWVSSTTEKLHITGMALISQDNDTLRSMAFALFGAVAGCMKRRRQAYYTSQVRQSLAMLLFYLEDPNLQVAKAKEKPAVLEGLYQTAQRHYMSLWIEIQAASVKFTACRVIYEEGSDFLDLFCSLLANIGAPEVKYITNVQSIKFLIQTPYTPLKNEDDHQLTVDDIYSLVNSNKH